VRTAIGVIFGLFIICFIVIIIEELFIGGRKRRLAEKRAKEKHSATDTGNRT
jgi:hypothetical protein